MFIVYHTIEINFGKKCQQNPRKEEKHRKIHKIPKKHFIVTFTRLHVSSWLVEPRVENASLPDRMCRKIFTMFSVLSSTPGHQKYLGAIGFIWLIPGYHDAVHQVYFNPAMCNDMYSQSRHPTSSISSNLNTICCSSAAHISVLESFLSQAYFVVYLLIHD